MPKNWRKRGIIVQGDRVRVHPVIGEEPLPEVWTVRTTGRLGHGEPVAWLEGKSGAWGFEALSHAEEGGR